MGKTISFKDEFTFGLFCSILTCFLFLFKIWFFFFFFFFLYVLYSFWDVCLFHMNPICRAKVRGITWHHCQVPKPSPCIFSYFPKTHQFLFCWFILFLYPTTQNMNFESVSIIILFLLVGFRSSFSISYSIYRFS